jgi:tRNA (guanine37-N1)-methyltransferase
MLRKAMKGLMSDDELGLLFGGFDIIGDIAIIKIPEQLFEKRFQIGQTLITQVKPVKTVLMQTTPVSGEYRIRELTLLCGEDRTSTIYTEHGCRFKVNLTQTYFSPRLSAERLRIAQMVKPGEKIVNMFAGIGVFSIIIAKKVPQTTIYNIDLNPAAHILAIENIKLNKLSDRIFPLLGDARRVMNGLEKMADRVIMPLPEKAIEYLDVAISALKNPWGFIHIYTHIYGLSRSDAFKNSIKELKKSITVKYELLDHRVVREIGPRWYQIALDLKVIT